MAEPTVAPGDHRYDGLSGEGSDLGRILALSDGVFAFAMTLLVVNLVLPTIGSSAQAPGDLGAYLGNHWLSILGYAISFLVIASWWSQHHRMFAAIRRYDERLVRLNNFFLLTISITPFMLALVFDYGQSQVFGGGTSAKLAVGLYSAAQLVSGLLYLAMWRHATSGHRLVDPALPDEWIRYLDRHAIGRVLIMTGAIAAAAVLPVLGEVLWVGVLIDRRQIQRPDAPARAE